MRTRRLKLALLGRDVSQSESPKIHQFILNRLGLGCEYELVSVSEQELDLAVKRLLGEFDGFNVTIPYKRALMAYLDEIKDDGRAFGAINTVVCSSQTGYNTDGLGFMKMLEFAGVDVLGKRALLLGAGGAGRGVAVVLKRAGAKVYAYRRNKSALQEFCDELGITSVDEKSLRGYDIVVNATGVGMHETKGVSPVTDDVFDGVEWAVDLIYQPQETEFLRQARAKGCGVLNGAGMLFYQAYYADCYYLGKTADDKEADELYLAYRKICNERKGR